MPVNTLDNNLLLREVSFRSSCFFCTCILYCGSERKFIQMLSREKIESLCDLRKYQDSRDDD
jgi:hypothetical protein